MSNVNELLTEELSAPVIGVECVKAVTDSLPLVLIHGWGCDSRTWKPLIDHIDGRSLWVVDLPGFGVSTFGVSTFGASHVGTAADIEAEIRLFEDVLISQLPPQFALLGWSLGGMLATRLAARFPSRVARLVTLASNVTYVQQPEWPEAMPQETFEGFVQGFTKSPEVTLKRFCGLMAKGDADTKALIKQTRDLSAESFVLPQTDSGEQNRGKDWFRSLQWLADIDNREALEQLSVKSLHLFGRHDALVPESAASQLKRLQPSAEVAVFPNRSHVLHHDVEILGKVSAFLGGSSLHDSRSDGFGLDDASGQSVIEKQKVAESFSKAAPHYDSVAGLQRDIADKLEFMVNPKTGRGVWLDLGSGTGYKQPWLHSHSDYYIGLDLAMGMLNYSRSQGLGENALVCGDAESLPIASNIIDGIFSSLAIQWCSDFERLLEEISRVLKPGGVAYIATLGKETLHEMKSSWAQVDNYVHVNTFVGESELLASVDRSSLVLGSNYRESRVLEYGTLRQLTHELKTLGAHNMNSGQSSGLTGRARIQQFREAYEAFRTEAGTLPATYDVIYFALKKPD